MSHATWSHLILFALLIPVSAHASYKCKLADQTVFQDLPCQKGEQTSVSATPADDVRERRQERQAASARANELGAQKPIGRDALDASESETSLAKKAVLQECVAGSRACDAALLAKTLNDMLDVDVTETIGDPFKTERGVPFETYYFRIKTRDGLLVVSLQYRPARSPGRDKVHNPRAW